MMKQFMLFGDHMSIELPEDAQDVSSFREIPDNQEVFTHSVTDQSIIVEILEYVEQPDMEALKTHYEDIAGSNEADDDSDVMNVEEIPLGELALTHYPGVLLNLDMQTFRVDTLSKGRHDAPRCVGAYALKGRQMVSKFKESAKNTVHVYMALLRLPEFQTDLVISFNNPVNVNPDSTSHAAIPVSSVGPWNDEQFAHSIKTLTLLNPGLFAT